MKLFKKLKRVVIKFLSNVHIKVDKRTRKSSGFRVRGFSVGYSKGIKYSYIISIRWGGYSILFVAVSEKVRLFFYLAVRPRLAIKRRVRRFNNWCKYNLPRKKSQLKLWWNEVVLRQSIYYACSSTDCDMVSSSWYGVASNRKAYREVVDSLYESAEGSVGIGRVSKDEYLEYGHERHTRDRVMEAYENGRGWSTYV